LENGATTIGIMTFAIMTLCMTILNAVFSITTLSIFTISMGRDIQYNDTRHINKNVTFYIMTHRTMTLRIRVLNIIKMSHLI